MIPFVSETLSLCGATSALQAITMLCLLPFIVALSVIHWIAVLFWSQSLCCHPPNVSSGVLAFKLTFSTQGLNVCAGHHSLTCFAGLPIPDCCAGHQGRVPWGGPQGLNAVLVLKVTMVALEFKTSISLLALQASITMHPTKAFLAV